MLKNMNAQEHECLRTYMFKDIYVLKHPQIVTHIWQKAVFKHTPERVCPEPAAQLQTARLPALTAATK